MKSNKWTSVAFVPYWGRGNPYQTQLAQGLQRSGVDVYKYRSLRTLARRISLGRFRPDVVHLHWINSFGWRGLGLARMALFLLRLGIIRLRGIRLVWTVHNLIPHETTCPRLDRVVACLTGRIAHTLIVHSPAAGRQVAKALRMGTSRPISVVPHANYIGCYPDDMSQEQARQRLGVSGSGLVFLFLGSIRPYKGVLELVEAFNSVADGNCCLVIAGRPIDQGTDQEIALAIGGRPDIVYRPGFVQDDEIQVYMNACDAVVFPYSDILSSGAIVLAMSFGRPCIAPRLGCLQDVLDESGAFLYDPAVKDGLAAALQRAISRSADLSSMGEYNRERIDPWTWDVMAQLTADVYRRCLQKTKREPGVTEEGSSRDHAQEPASSVTIAAVRDSD